MSTCPCLVLEVPAATGTGVGSQCPVHPPHHTLPTWPVILMQVVVDECHCVTEWGHSFRPSYYRLGGLLNSPVLASGRVLALTATATITTQHAICASLGIRESSVIRDAPLRSNLRLHVVHRQNGRSQGLDCRERCRTAVLRIPGTWGAIKGGLNAWDGAGDGRALQTGSHACPNPKTRSKCGMRWCRSGPAPFGGLGREHADTRTPQGREVGHCVLRIQGGCHDDRRDAAWRRRFGRSVPCRQGSQGEAVPEGLCARLPALCGDGPHMRTAPERLQREALDRSVPFRVGCDCSQARDAFRLAAPHALHLHRNERR